MCFETCQGLTQWSGRTDPPYLEYLLGDGLDDQNPSKVDIDKHNKEYHLCDNARAKCVECLQALHVTPAK